MSKLKNVTRVKTERGGKTTWLLLDDAGNSISAYSYFCENNSDYAFATQKRYAEAVSLFIDFLIEARAFGQAASKTHINAVLDNYPLLLRDGSAALSARVEKNLQEHPEDEWIPRVAKALDRSPLKPNSFSNTLAGINRFLRLSKSLATEAFERASLKGIEHQDQYQELIESLTGSTYFSEAEKRALRQNSMLGSVMRFRGEGLVRPRRMKLNGAHVQNDVRRLDFPIEMMMPLARAATSWRDRALWLLVGGCGLRISEALNLRWVDIDIEKQKVYIYDPHGRHFGGDLTPQEKLRFKGRNVSITYLIQMFRPAFFQALEQYLKKEFIPPRDRDAASYVFQYVEDNRRGLPYLGVSDAALNNNFKAACRRARIPGPISSSERDWSPHSLRHMYGVYMLNDYPVDPAAGKFGLELPEVQLLMGHESIKSTALYAREKRRNIERKLEHSDKQLLGMTAEEQLLIVSENTKLLGEVKK